jgi:hypothetical protein
MAGGSLTENSCMLCGRGCPLTTQICTTSCRPTVAAPNHFMLKRVAATWYPTVFDERNKTNAQN